MPCVDDVETSADDTTSVAVLLQCVFWCLQLVYGRLLLLPAAPAGAVASALTTPIRVIDPASTTTVRR